MRGKGRYTDQRKDRGRITPAYAGKSAGNSAIEVSHRDHPRLCGEKSGNALNPPRRTRITPAYAGKSFIIDCRLQAGQDHPRLCGEKL